MNGHIQFLITCEHGGNRIPAAYLAHFVRQEDLLHSHRGYDPGALAMARELAQRLDAPLHYSTVSRLLVDLNRSPRHPRLHGETIRALPEGVRRDIVERHYLPYRERVEGSIADVIKSGRCVIHISSHSFTPVLDGEVRTADIGLLYDPARPGEVLLCKAWLESLKARAPALRLRRNYPYRGTSDGFTAWLRRRFTADRYIGIELEINQAMVLAAGPAWSRLRGAVCASLLDARAEFAARLTESRSSGSARRPRTRR